MCTAKVHLNEGGDGRNRTGDRAFAEPRLNHLATSPDEARNGNP